MKLSTQMLINLAYECLMHEGYSKEARRLEAMFSDLKDLPEKWRKDWETCARGNEWYNTKSDAADELEELLK